jgi:N-acetylglutamate synthase-like GNAT family acetyltransferase
VEVRRAGRGDLTAVARVAEVTHWDAYAGLLDPATISGLLRRDFSPGALRRRLLSRQILVAEEAGRVVGFGEALVDDDHLRLTALAVDPPERRTAVGARLLAAIRELAPGWPVSADVLLGCLPVEGYLEAQGFAPGEVLQTVLFGEETVERRWWLPPG